MRYFYFHWAEPEWTAKLDGLEHHSEEYWKEWDRHLGRTDNFCDFYKAMTALARELFEKHVRTTIAQHLAALEAGDIHYFKVDDLECYVKEVDE